MLTFLGFDQSYPEGIQLRLGRGDKSLLHSFHYGLTTRFSNSKDTGMAGLQPTRQDIAQQHQQQSKD